LNDLMGNNIQILVDVPSTLMPHVRGGKIKALAMFSAKRIAGAPEVPTMAEAGGPPLEASTWILFLAPAGTPREIVQLLAANVAKAAHSPDLRHKLVDQGADPVGNTPEEFQRQLDKEVASWLEVVKVSGAKAD